LMVEKENRDSPIPIADFQQDFHNSDSTKLLSIQI